MRRISKSVDIASRCEVHLKFGCEPHMEKELEMSQHQNVYAIILHGFASCLQFELFIEIDLKF